MTNTASFQTYMQDTAALVEKELCRLLPDEGTAPATIHRAMRYSACGGGKRLRAMLACEAAGLAGKPVAAALPLAAAVEMIHAYSLIHDDLPCMDDDDLRRGKPTNHKVFGEGMAVLAGDALLTQAFDVLGRLPALTGASADTAIRIVAEVAAAAGTAGLVGGQVADLEAEGTDPGDRALEVLQFIHTRKTGALFRCCLRTGAILGGLGDSDLALVDTYAENFGLAFQIVDDVLDVIGESKLLGKTAGSDVRKDKLTYPRIFGLQKSRQMAVAAVQTACEALAPFGDRAERLMQLAQYVVERDH